MYEFITEKTLPEYEAFVQSHPKGNFAQSYLWGKQKPMWKWDAVAVRGADGKRYPRKPCRHDAQGPRYRQNPHVRLPRSGVRP